MLNIPQCTGCPLQQRIIWTQMPVVARVRNAEIDKKRALTRRYRNCWKPLQGNTGQEERLSIKQGHFYWERAGGGQERH